MSFIVSMMLWFTLSDLPIEIELDCLATNVYYEAGSEPTEGKVAVAQVTLNRVRSKGFPNSVCGVVYQQNPRGCQFSWVCEDELRPINPEAYAKAYTISKDVLEKKRSIPVLSKALFFHNPSVFPMWTVDSIHLATIGGHLFYAPR